MLARHPLQVGGFAPLSQLLQATLGHPRPPHCEHDSARGGTELGLSGGCRRSHWSCRCIKAATFSEVTTGQADATLPHGKGKMGLWGGLHPRVPPLNAMDENKSTKT